MLSEGARKCQPINRDDDPNASPAHLHKDVLCLILQEYLDQLDRTIVRHVCKRWYRAARGGGAFIIPQHLNVFAGWALQHKRVNLLHWIQSVYPPPSEGTWLPYSYEFFACVGDLPKLQMLYELPYTVWNPTVLQCAAQNGHIHVLEWARSMQLSRDDGWNESVCIMAKDADQTEVLEWLSTHDCPCGGKKHE